GVPGAAARHAGRGDRPARGRTAGRVRPRRRWPYPRRRLLGRHEEEDRAGLRPVARPAGTGARRAVRGGGPAVGGHDPRHPDPVRGRWRHGHLLQPCAGAGRAAVHARGDPRRRHHQGGRHARRGTRWARSRRRVRRDGGRPGGHRRGAVVAVTATAPVRTRYFVRLKLRLLRNGLRGPGTRVFGFVLGLVVGFWMAAAGFLWFLLAGLEPRADIGLVTVVFTGSAIVLGWVLLPLLFFGVDETLDPARFALLPLPRRTLARGMLAAAAVGIPGVATAVALAGAVVAAGTRGGVPGAAVGLAGAVLTLLLCVAASRALTSAFAALLRSRRARDLTALLLAVVAASVGPIQLFANSLAVHASLAPVLRAARVLAWTPLGAGFAAPYDIVAHRPLLAAARLAI